VPPGDELSTRDVSLVGPARRPGGDEVWALVLVWAREEPGRLGEVALVTGPAVLGRGEARAEDPAPRLGLLRQRPGSIERMAPIASSGVSRIQARIEPRSEGLDVCRLGRREVRVAGRALADGEVGRAAAGDTIVIEEQLVFLVARRAALWPRTAAPVDFAFGAMDPHGLVGESPAAWALRAAGAFAAQVPAHVLVHGPSGAGKELVARAIHATSARGARPLVARNAATFPEGLIDAELFGNARGYPHAGAPERPGLIGEADGSTLFLDEIGELPASLQAHLLRLLDRGGEYHRLGDAQPRRADLRVIAATNRDPHALKHDLAARLTLRVAIPGLDARREDIPLLVQHLLAQAGAAQPALVARFRSPHGDGFRIAAALADALVRHSYATGVRQLERLVWQAVAESPGELVELGPETRAALAAAPPARAAASAGPGAAPDLAATPTAVEPDAPAIRAALVAADGSVSRAAAALGLRSRYALYRLLRKHGIARDDA
jgi:DNA-binding NtrC family response regulator